MNCLEDCNGACCKINLIPIKGELPLDYLEARGLAIYDFEGKRYLMVSNRCQYLTESGACSIQATKPMFCRSQEAGCSECRLCREIMKTEG
jgi:Fe-S-cluster containining protein